MVQFVTSSNSYSRQSANGKKSDKLSITVCASIGL